MAWPNMTWSSKIAFVSGAICRRFSWEMTNPRKDSCDDACFSSFQPEQRPVKNTVCFWLHWPWQVESKNDPIDRLAQIHFTLTSKTAAEPYRISHGKAAAPLCDSHLHLLGLTVVIANNLSWQRKKRRIADACRAWQAFIYNNLHVFAIVCMFFRQRTGKAGFQLIWSNTLIWWRSKEVGWSSPVGISYLTNMLGTPWSRHTTLITFCPPLPGRLYNKPLELGPSPSYYPSRNGCATKQHVF